MRESQIRRSHANMDLLIIGAAVRPSTHATQWHAAQLIESIRGKAKRLAKRRVNACNDARYCTDNYQRGTARLEKEILREVEHLRLRAPGIISFELTGALCDCVRLEVKTHMEGGATFSRTVWL